MNTIPPSLKATGTFVTTTCEGMAITMWDAGSLPLSHSHPPPLSLSFSRARARKSSRAESVFTSVDLGDSQMTGAPGSRGGSFVLLVELHHIIQRLSGTKSNARQGSNGLGALLNTHDSHSRTDTHGEEGRGGTREPKAALLTRPQTLPLCVRATRPSCLAVAGPAGLVRA